MFRLLMVDICQPGNDDYGTMSAWYIFGALGFYPVAGSDVYAIGSPLFQEIVVKKGDGYLTVKANNLSDENIYVERVEINGKSIDMKNPFLVHQQLAGNATLEFWMQNNPKQY
jgi:putative alpha-1,2-mannosidase